SACAGPPPSGSARSWARRRTAPPAAAAAAAIASSLPMQHADQGEQAPCGVEVELHLARQPIHQDIGALVVQGAAGHVERLDAVGRGGADGGVVAVADGVVVLDD